MSESVSARLVAGYFEVQYVYQYTDDDDGWLVELCVPIESSDNKKQKHLLVIELGMAKRSSKSTETKDELSTTCNPKIMSRCLSVPDATSLHHCLQNHRQYFTILS